MNRLSITVLFLIASLAASTGCVAESESTDSTDSVDTSTETGVAMTKDPSGIHGAGDVGGSDVAQTTQSALTAVTPNTVNPILEDDDGAGSDKKGPQPEPWHPTDALQVLHPAEQGHSK